VGSYISSINYYHGDGINSSNISISFDLYLLNLNFTSSSFTFTTAFLGDVLSVIYYISFIFTRLIFVFVFFYFYFSFDFSLEGCTSSSWVSIIYSPSSS